MSTPLFTKIAVIGTGLIGSSLVRAVREGGLAAHVACYDGDSDVRAVVARLEIADSVAGSAAEVVADAELVVLAVPVGVCGDVAAEIGPHLAAGAIVTDVGSVKADIIKAVAPHLPAGVHLVPGHPVAGTEHSGPEAGFAELFRDRWCILTPPDGADPKAVERVAGLWRQVGSDVEIMSAVHHDRVLAMTSHLPHLIAYTIVATASDLENLLRTERENGDVVTTAEVIKYSAGGFRDFTRIAASDPVMWRDVFLHNKEAVLEMLGRFTEDLTALQRAIRWDDGDQLEALFRRTRDIRRSVIEAGQAGKFVYTENGKNDKDPKA